MDKSRWINFRILRKMDKHKMDKFLRFAKKIDNIGILIISSPPPYQIVCILEENAAPFVPLKNDDVM